MLRDPYPRQTNKVTNRPSATSRPAPRELAAWVAELAARGYRPRSVATYRRVLASPLGAELAGGAELAELAELAPTTRALYVAAVRAFRRWRGELAPLAGVRIRLDRSSPRPLRDVEDAALLAASRTAPRRVRLLHGLLRDAGLRIGEALALDWLDVELAQGAELLTVRASKSREDAAIPIPSGALRPRAPATRLAAAVRLHPRASARLGAAVVLRRRL